MGQTPQKKPTKKWTILDITTTIFFILVLIFFLLVFTPLGDPLAASGRQTMIRTSNTGPAHRRNIVSAIEDGSWKKTLELCPDDYVDYMPCEDPKRNSQLSRVMNFYRERHCPNVVDELLCLVPSPKGYKVPVTWPESLHKVYFLLARVLNCRYYYFSTWVVIILLCNVCVVV